MKSVLVVVVLCLVALTVFVSAEQRDLESAVFKIIFDDLSEEEQTQFLADELSQFKIKLPKIKLPKIKIPTELKCASCSACPLLGNPLAAAACKIACDKLVREKNNCGAETNSEEEFKIRLPKIKIPSTVKCAACDACGLLSNPFAAMACKYGCDKLVREKNNCDSVETSSDAAAIAELDENIIFKILFPHFERLEDSEFRIKLPKIPSELKCAACDQCSKISNPLGSMACRVACNRIVREKCSTTVQSESEFKIKFPKIKLPKIKIPKEIKCASCDACALLGNPLASMACKVACDKLVREKNSCDAVPTPSGDVAVASDMESMTFDIIFNDLEDEEQLADEGSEFKIKLPKIKLPKIKIPSAVKCAACEGCSLLSNPFAAMACKYGCDKLVREKNNCDGSQTESDIFPIEDPTRTSLPIGPVKDESAPEPKKKTPCTRCQKGCQAIKTSSSRQACMRGCATWACRAKKTQEVNADAEFKIRAPLPADACLRCKNSCSKLASEKTKSACVRGCDTWVCAAISTDSEFRG